MSDNDMKEIEASMSGINVDDPEKKRKINYIKAYIMSNPELKDLKLNPREVYNSINHDNWEDLRKEVSIFIRSELSKNKKSGAPVHKKELGALNTKLPNNKPSMKPSMKPSVKPFAKPSVKPSTITSTSIEPTHMGMGGNKSRRNIRSRRNSKKHKRVRHTRRKQTRRHRHSRRR